MAEEKQRQEVKAPAVQPKRPTQPSPFEREDHGSRR